MITLFLLLSCRYTPEPSPVVTVEVLDPVARANRVSVALRGVRPSPEELDRVAADPSALRALATTWTQDPRFGDTVRDLFADVLWMRADTKPQWPAVGAAAQYTKAELVEAMQESPLRLVEHVVMEARPFTEIVTGDYTVADPITAVLEGLAHDPDGPEWQESHYVDGRPHAGLLSQTHFFQRWYTNFSGKQRNRGNMITRAFLCAEIGAIDMPVFPDVDPSDNGATAEALRDNPACAACHVNLDPLAAYFWGYHRNIVPQMIHDAEADGCEPGELCYPLAYWLERRADDYENYDLPGPGYFGEPGDDVRHLGASIAADWRFADCAVQNAWAFFAQDQPTSLDAELRQQLADQLRDDGDWRRMALELVLSDPLARPDRVLQLRPEAMGRMLADVTDHRWALQRDNFGAIDPLSSSLHGLRDLAGGTDHDRVLVANHSPGPTVLLAWDAVAREAAEEVVAQGVIDASLQETAAVRAQLEAWVLRTTGRADDDQVASLHDLFRAALAQHGRSDDAWAVVIRASLLDPAMVTY